MKGKPKSLNSGLKGAGVAGTKSSNDGMFPASGTRVLGPRYAGVGVLLKTEGSLGHPQFLDVQMGAAPRFTSEYIPK